LVIYFSTRFFSHHLFKNLFQTHTPSNPDNRLVLSFTYQTILYQTIHPSSL
jgi:hypothetical protein